ncbi:MAG: stealth family protein [Legionellaceae bacterium]|nr:stealth family protein [Legionellaceae bacterium]
MIVDAVVTWVDGADKAHREKRLRYIQSLHGAVEEEAQHATRFASSGEIDFCLRSLLQFAPWIRTIYIVTDAQEPPVLSRLRDTPDGHRLCVVDHREIFRGFEQYLPTFNSLTIESMLWRIPGLSERFIYLNDDCMLLRPLTKEAFFRDGKPVVRGCWKTQTSYKWGNRCKRFLGKHVSVAAHRRFQERSARIAGFNKRFLHLPHVPFPLLKQTFVDFFERYPSLLQKNVQHALRDSTQFWPMSLAYHLELKAGNVVLDNQLREVSVNPAHHVWHKMQRKLAQALEDTHTVFACVQSLDEATPEVRQALTHWLSQFILIDSEKR